MEFTKGHEKKLDRLDEIVRGNGKNVGIRAEVKTNSKSLAAILSGIRKATWLIITTLLTTVITLLITLGNQ